MSSCSFVFLKTQYPAPSAATCCQAVGATAAVELRLFVQELLLQELLLRVLLLLLLVQELLL